MTLSGKQPFGNERFHAPQITVAARKESVASNIRVANSQAYRFQALIRSRRSSAARSRLMSADRKISSSCARVVALTMGFEGGVGRTQDIGLRKTPSEGFHRPSYKRSSSYAIRSPGTRRRMVDRVRQDAARIGGVIAVGDCLLDRSVA